MVRKDKEMGVAKEDKPLGPQSYEAHASFKSTQLPKPKFHVNHGANQNFIDSIVKVKKSVPGVGHYNIEKALTKVTIGLSRGWK